MLGYVLGLRERIAEHGAVIASAGDVAGIFASRVASDKRTIADILAHECEIRPDAVLRLRVRDGVGDVFACLSPGYEPADAPDIVPDIVRLLPGHARGSFSYDPTTTAWEVRGHVFTPTPVAQQAVGEPFEGFVSFRSRDNGTSRLRGGGGISLLRCLNASVYCVNGVDVARVHRKGIQRDVGVMVRKSASAIDTLCAAWGTARAETIEIPTGTPINEAIPGFWRYCLKASTSELAGILPGRSEAHVAGLTSALHGERRDPRAPLSRADMAQGWTRYIQDQPTAVRRDAEAAIGQWMVSEQAFGCDARA